MGHKCPFPITEPERPIRKRAPDFGEPESAAAKAAKLSKQTDAKLAKMKENWASKPEEEKLKKNKARKARRAQSNAVQENVSSRPSARPLVPLVPRGDPGPLIQTPKPPGPDASEEERRQWHNEYNKAYKKRKGGKK